MRREQQLMAQSQELMFRAMQGRLFAAKNYFKGCSLTFSPEIPQPK